MAIPEAVKGGFHAVFGAIALIMGIYNASKPKPKNRALALFYGIIVGTEIGCIFDHVGGENAPTQRPEVR